MTQCTVYMLSYVSVSCMPDIIALIDIDSLGLSAITGEMFGTISALILKKTKKHSQEIAVQSYRGYCER